MKIISQEDLNQYEFKDSFKQSLVTNLVREQLDKIERGQVLFLGKDEWNIKSSPSCMINSWYIKKNTGKVFSSRTLRDESGWIIKREK